jgi:methyltransferase (TIGR00027 family)
MEQERPSLTAEGVAIMRALHQTLDDESRLLVDPIASRLVDPAVFEQTRAAFEHIPPATAARLRLMFVLRSRYAEDCLAEAFNNGTRQYVILGAGLDTFAYRQPPWAEGLSVFEVDHPSSQQAKRSRLSAAGISVPPNVKLVAIDIERNSLHDGLSGAAFDFKKPAMFSMLGVTQYLREDALDPTLKLVRSTPAGSEIVFSFVLPDDDLPAEEIPLAAMSAAGAAAGGEPWLTRFHPARLEGKLAAMGFSTVERLTPAQATQRYLSYRRDGLRAFAMEQMIRATV